MKILHISTFNSGGAFTGAQRLHRALLKQNVDSKILVSKLHGDLIQNGVILINQEEKSINTIRRIKNKIGISRTAKQKRYNFLKGKRGNYELISFPFSDYDITQTQVFKECDIVHLHWVAGFLDYETFFKKCNKPIVITLRDLFPIQGIFHYKQDVIDNSQIFGDINHIMLKIKKNSVLSSKVPIAVVGISHWISQESQKSEILGHLKHYAIPNCIDVNSFQLYNKDRIKKEFNIPKNHLVLSFVSDGIDNKRKGIDLLVKAIECLQIAIPVTVLTVGSGIPPKFKFHITHRHLGKLTQKELNEVYCVSDAFIFPSREEALGNVMLEAMSCGIPVIGTPVGGLLDVIVDGVNGVLAENLTVEGLSNAIAKFYQTKNNFNRIEIRNFIKNNFNENIIFEKYKKVYLDLLNSN